MKTDFKAGDLIAISGRAPVSWIIQMGTMSLPNVLGLGKLGLSGISHVGVVAQVFDQMIVYESTSFDRPQCVRTGRQKPKGVQAHRLSTILDAGGDVFHYPLKRPLYDHEEFRLLGALEECLGRDYDMFGAATAWGGLLRWSARRLVAKENLASLFCSELVAHAWGQIGLLQTPSSDIWNPARLARFAVRQGICHKPRRVT